MKRRPPPFVYLVRYQREGWPWRQQRVFFVESAAYRLVEKLQSPGRWQGQRLRPLVFLSLVRRPLGREEVLEQWEE